MLVYNYACKYKDIKFMNYVFVFFHVPGKDLDPESRSPSYKDPVSTMYMTLKSTCQSKLRGEACSWLL